MASRFSSVAGPEANPETRPQPSRRWARLCFVVYRADQSLRLVLPTSKAKRARVAPSLSRHCLGRLSDVVHSGLVNVTFTIRESNIAGCVSPFRCKAVLRVLAVTRFDSSHITAGESDCAADCHSHRGYGSYVSVATRSSISSVGSGSPSDPHLVVHRRILSLGYGYFLILSWCMSVMVAFRYEVPGCEAASVVANQYTLKPSVHDGPATCRASPGQHACDIAQRYAAKDVGAGVSDTILPVGTENEGKNGVVAHCGRESEGMANM
jgi:hypothetical protein